jgi:hypothetical protein
MPEGKRSRRMLGRADRHLPLPEAQASRKTPIPGLTELCRRASGEDTASPSGDLGVAVTHPAAGKFYAPWAKTEGFSIDGMALFAMDCESQSKACFRDPISRYPTIRPGITHSTILSFREGRWAPRHHFSLISGVWPLLMMYVDAEHGLSQDFYQP